MKHLLFPAICVALATQAHAQTDTNTNGLSDLWEKSFHNGQLFSAANPAHAPTADPDGDGWTNLQEAQAGTNPFHSLPPFGMVMPSISITPATYEPLPEGSVPPPDETSTSPRILLDPAEIRLTWQPIPGKTYRALLSPDLLSWSPASGTFVGGNDPITYETVPINEDGTVPEKLFWRVETGDTDTDGDTITDYEEILRNLNSLSSDTDGDGLPDNLDPAPLVNSLQAIWDADSVEPTGAPLFAAFNFTPATSGSYPFSAEHVTDLSGNNRHGKARTQFQTTPPIDSALQDNAEGIANHGFRFANTHHFAFDLKSPSINFSPVTSLSFWLKTKAADLEGNGQPVFSYVPQLCVFAQKVNSANSTAARAFVRKQLGGTGYEVVWMDWTFPGNIVREHWNLDLAASQLDGRWINLTFVWQGGNGASQDSYWACYANGVRQTRNYNSVIPFVVSPDAPQDTFLIGADAAGGSGQNNMATVRSTFKGTMDRVRIYTAALTQAQVDSIVQQDTDKDGLWDITEAAATTLKDTNSNARRDIGEIRYPDGSPLIWQHSGTDSDRDGITDIQEQNLTKTDPYNHDSDRDLLPDGWENQHNLDPNSPAGINGQTGDPDNDGLDNFREWQHLTNPHLADSDGDKKNDAIEIIQGSDPNSAADNGQAPPPEETLTLKILVGDPSTSHSERWRVEATEVESGQVVLRHASRQYGQVTPAAESTFNQFKPGKAYSFRLIHAGTDPDKLATDPERTAYPDYDWTLQISYKNADGTFTDVTDPAQTKVLLLDPYNNDTKSHAGEGTKLLAPETPWGSIGEGQAARPAYYEKIEPMRVVLLPVETLTGIPGSSDETPGNWIAAESHPKPTVEMTVVSAVVTGNDLEITVQGTVTDPLSKYAYYPVERLQKLAFKHQNQIIHAILLPAIVGDGYEFEETFTIRTAQPFAYVIRAETSQNYAGFTGYDEISVALGWMEKPDAFPVLSGPLSIYFPVAPSLQTKDQAFVYVGVGNPPVAHGQTSETTAESNVFTGSYFIPISQGNLTANCQFAFSSPPVFSSTQIDSVVIGLASEIQNRRSNYLYSRWIETTANSRIFREQTEWSFSNQVLTVLGTENLRGTPPSSIKPCVVRLPSLPDGGDDPGKIRIIAGERKYRLIRIGDHWYPEDPAKRGTPKLFVPSTSAMPSRLKAHGYDPLTGYFDISLKLDDTTTFGQAARFHVVPGRDLPNEPLSVPLTAQAADAQTHWQPSEPVDTDTVLAAYRMIHAESPFALELLACYLRGNHLVETKDLVTGYLDLDVDLGPILYDLNDNIWTIQIEEDINPIHAANLLFEGLKSAYLEIEVQRNERFDGDDNAEAFKVAMQQAVLNTQKTTIAATELYLSGLGVINEGLDWIIIVNDVADGHPESLAAALPFISAGLIKSGGHLIIRNGDKVLDTLDAEAVAALRDLGINGNLATAGTVYDAYGFSEFLRKALSTDSGPVRPPRDGDHGLLRKAMEDILPRPSFLHQAHHDFPWAMKGWFADHGINVNNPAFGRWVKKDEHGAWHGWRGGEFNAWWRAVEAEEKALLAAGEPSLTKQQIIQKLIECRQQFPDNP